VGPRCPACGQAVDRPEEGYYLGALLFNLVAAELLLAGAVLALMLATWPDVPWTAVMYGGAVLMVLIPVFCYPFAKLTWLAVDLRLQPHLRESLRPE
jgi:hypothetical protein